MNRIDVADLGWDLATDGFAGRDAAVRDVVRTARAVGLSPVLTAVLGDPRAPEVARLRAFGHLAAALAALDARPSVVSAHAA